MKTFLLRFEERIVQAPPPQPVTTSNDAPASNSGPKTITELKSEGADADPGAQSYSTFRT